MGDRPLACRECGALLGDERRHQRWHRDQAERRIRFVGGTAPVDLGEVQPEPPPAYLPPTKEDTEDETV